LSNAAASHFASTPSSSARHLDPVSLAVDGSGCAMARVKLAYVAHLTVAMLRSLVAELGVAA
jgi:hypothetical protein